MYIYVTCVIWVKRRDLFIFRLDEVSHLYNYSTDTGLYDMVVSM